MKFALSLCGLALSFSAACGHGQEHEHPRQHAAATTGNGVEHFEGVGQYLFDSTENGQTIVTINHLEIPGFMDAMAMPYVVQDPSLVEGLEPGEDIRFRVVLEDGGFYFIDRIAPISGGSR